MKELPLFHPPKAITGIVHQLCSMGTIIRSLAIMLLLSGCAAEGTEEGSIEWTDATETFTGTVKGVEMIFQHKDTLHYRLAVAGEVVRFTGISPEARRRIVRLATQIWMPIPESHPHAKTLREIGEHCPVHRALDASVDKPITFHWAE